MKLLRTLRSRLIASHLFVIAVVVAAGFTTVRLLTPAFFGRRVQVRAGSSPGQGAGSGSVDGVLTVPAPVERAYNDALTIALVISAVIGLVLAVILAYLLAARLLRRLGEVREATHRIAAGEYGNPVPVPAEAELADLAGSVNALGAALAATEKTRAGLISDLAHELRNPLSTIEGYMEGLVDGVLPASAETYETIAGEAHRLTRLTDDLSLLARMQEGALDLDEQPADLAEVGRVVAEYLRPQFDAKGVALSASLGDPLPIRADVDRLRQAVTNVVGNALTHTPPGGSVSLFGRCDAATCTLEVIDTGEGIAPDQLDVIFSRYTRLGEGPGTGIGLNIARTLVRRHGGELTAASPGRGGGSIFTLTLPGR